MNRYIIVESSFNNTVLVPRNIYTIPQIVNTNNINLNLLIAKIIMAQCRFKMKKWIESKNTYYYYDCLSLENKKYIIDSIYNNIDVYDDKLNKVLNGNILVKMYDNIY
jgi:hypothetical protein